MMEYKLKNEKLINLIFKISIVICLLLFGLLIGLKFTDNFTNLNIVLIALIAFVSVIVEFIISVIVHEFGHMVLGLISGYEFHYFQIFNFRIYKDENKKLKFKFIKTPILGQCIMYPKGEIKDLKYKGYMYGGALFNLILSIILLAVVIPVYVLNKKLLYFTSTLSVMNLFMFLNNGLPLTAGFIDNDCKNLLLMNKHEEIKYTILNSLLIQYYQDLNLSVLDFDETLLKNNNYTMPYDYVHYVPFVILRTIKNVVIENEDPFWELRELFYKRNKLPFIYKVPVTELILYYYLVNMKEHRGILADKNNKAMFKHPDKTDPLIMLDLVLIDYVEHKINADEAKAKIKDLNPLLNEKKLAKVEIELYSKLFDDSKLFIETKEALLNENECDSEPILN